MASFCDAEQVDKRQECCEKHEDDVTASCMDKDDESEYSSPSNGDIHCTSGSVGVSGVVNSRDCWLWWGLWGPLRDCGHDNLRGCDCYRHKWLK